MGKEISEKKKALEIAMGQIEKDFGKGSVMKLGDFRATNVEAIPTGALSLDIALRNRRNSKRQNSRNIWTRIFWKNHIGITYNCRSTKNGWRSCIYRCRTRIRSGICKKSRSRYR